MDLLRRLGTVEGLEGRASQNRRRIAEESDSNSAQSSERFRLAVWQRRAAASRRRENVSWHPERFGLAESLAFIGIGRSDEDYGRVRRKDDRPVRIRAANVLVRGHPSWRCL